MKSETKRKPDERVEKSGNKIYAKLFYVYMLELIILLGVKIAMGEELLAYALEIVCIVAGMAYVIARKAMNGILIVKEKDEVIEEISNDILTKGAMMILNIVLIGEIALIFTDVDFMWVTIYLLMWFVPTCVAVVYIVKNGLVLWGGNKKREEGRKKMIKPIILGSAMYGVLMCVMEGFAKVSEGKTFGIKDVMSSAGAAIMWGVFMYIFLVVILNIGEKRANKLEGNDEE